MTAAGAPRVFITGASSGLGAALAVEYARRDPQAVIGLLARRASALETVAEAVRGASSGSAQTLCLAADVTDPKALAAAAAEFLDRAGVPDVVIANAGISVGTDTGADEDSQTFRRIVATNLVAMPETFAPFIAAMRERRRGTLVGIGSVAGIRGLPGSGAYSASKAAVAVYLESLRVELRGSGVRVVTIAPGFIRTPMTARNRYSMPFLIDANVFARRAVDAIDRGRSYVVIPWQMGVLGAALRLLPDAVYDRILARAPRKARSEPAS